MDFAIGMFLGFLGGLVFGGEFAIRIGEDTIKKEATENGVAYFKQPDPNKSETVFTWKKPGND